MGSIRSQDTIPELQIRSLIHRLGFRFRVHSKKLPGRPDIVFSKHKKIILVHGCFWHRHADCSKGKLPKTNLDYWKPKLQRNKQRDAMNRRELESQGWRVLVIWQCELKKLNVLTKRIIRFLR
jgi:DNA mismatch endonuclease (patch repair protein)